MILLRHTPVLLPDTPRLRVSSQRRWLSPDGGGFEAVLRSGPRLVGHALDAGHGGETVFLPGPPPHGFSPSTLEDYRQACRRAGAEAAGPGERERPLTTAEVLDALVEEHMWDGKLRKARRRGCCLGRLEDPSGCWLESVQIPGPFTAAIRDPALVLKLYDGDVHQGQVWRLWDGQAWQTLPAPPPATGGSDGVRGGV